MLWNGDMCTSGASDQSLSWTRERISKALGQASARLIESIAKHAHADGISICLAGGVVRDLLMERENKDLDFLLEGDAIAFACKLARIYGGETERHIPFGTAKWKLDSAAMGRLSAGSQTTPQQIDFTTARTETYSAPAALPAVKPASIRQDLGRRDFTLNALALHIQAGSCPWNLLDPSNGYGDINGKQIRVLHERSFIDDPTRIFRAFRFACRFGFTIESGTAAVLREAIPMIRRLSGERIRHELDLILREAYPERIMADLSALDIFTQVHDAFRISARSGEQFQRLRQNMPQAGGNADELAQLGWHLLFSGIAENDAPFIAARLGLTSELSNSIAGFARLMAKADWLGAPATKASAITRFLDGISASAWRAGLICKYGDHTFKERMDLYMTDWRHRRTSFDGSALRRAGLAPGPIYREILDKLRNAWIDGEVESGEQERELFLKLVKEAE